MKRAADYAKRCADKLTADRNMPVMQMEKIICRAISDALSAQHRSIFGEFFGHGPINLDKEQR